jgi:hypothetical protein
VHDSVAAVTRRARGLGTTARGARQPKIDASTATPSLKACAYDPCALKIDASTATPKDPAQLANRCRAYF